MELCTAICSVDSRISLAWKYVEEQDFSRANAEFQALIEHDPSLDLISEYSQFLFDCISPQQSIDVLQRFLDRALAQSNFEECRGICNLLANSYRALQNPELGQHYQQRAVAFHLKFKTKFTPLSLDQESQLGCAHDSLLAGEYRHATTILLSLISNHDQIAAKAKLLLADVYLQLREFEAAFFVLDGTINWAVSHENLSLQMAALELKSMLYENVKDLESGMKTITAAMEIANSTQRCARHRSRLERYRDQLRLQISISRLQPEWN